MAIHPPLEVKFVAKSFSQGSTKVSALAGIDLTVQHGEFVAIMGASGSGKSTLLHAIAGLTDIDSGHVLVDGVDLATLSDSSLTLFRRNRIGLVFQAFNLIPTLSAEDNVRLPGLEKPGTEEKVEALFKRLGLVERRKHKPDALSGGEQQRVAIARALICDPALLLLDEPTGSLDSVAGQELCTLLRSLCTESNRTIIVVTHEPAVARWTDRVVILRDGLIVESFTTAGLADAQALAQRYQAAREAKTQ